MNVGSMWRCEKKWNNKEEMTWQELDSEEIEAASRQKRRLMSIGLTVIFIQEKMAAFCIVLSDNL